MCNSSSVGGSLVDSTLCCTKSVVSVRSSDKRVAIHFHVETQILIWDPVYRSLKGLWGFITDRRWLRSVFGLSIIQRVNAMVKPLLIPSNYTLIKDMTFRCSVIWIHVQYPFKFMLITSTWWYFACQSSSPNPIHPFSVLMIRNKLHRKSVIVFHSVTLWDVLVNTLLILKKAGGQMF